MMPNPTAANNLLGSLFALIARLPPEGLMLVNELIRAITRSKDPMRAVRLATMAVASKKASLAAIQKMIGK